ncbi:DUF4339 domain-containing protein [Allorhodopirellula solitaria]|uniref:GYF domain-containing protein n=1 Tax=Allorhodopirellula solitaria TaxID=2527987 RepID=A0A5C5WYN7_9BACT|nr:DUF4339 domain-containing protein [Allorhodopirellula solitaria]TWT56074.1 hypothetical protein CA85_45470 [Allorhodopirellula solitaria]
MTAWFVKRENEEVGPLRPADLLDLVRDGSVRPETMIRKNDSSWFSADSVGGLFEAARRPTIEHYCPHCENVRVAAPPSTCPKCDQNLTNTRQRIIENSLSKSSRTTKEPGASQGPALSARRWLQKRVGKDSSN